MKLTADAPALASSKTTQRWRWRHALRVPLLYLITISLSILFMAPFLWTVLSSLKSPWEMYAFPPILIPSEPQWGNYYEALVLFPFGQWFLNTVVIVILGTAGLLISSSLVAYGFARFDFRFKDFIFVLTLATLMLPDQVTLIPRFILFHQLGWINTLKPLWVPFWFGGTAFAIFLMRQFIMSVPRELDEAAIVDGASYFRVFWSIVIPLCKPALATLAIIAAIAAWNNFMEPLVYLNSTEKFTLSVGLRYFHANPVAGDRPLGHLLMAASVATIMPPIILFFAFQRYFVQGVALTGLKG
jgi:ABC-type glycerol-3-phosphate transport system permease component